MKELEKVNSAQLFEFWRSLSLGLLIIMGTFILSKILPNYFSPIIGLVAAAILYTMLYNSKMRGGETCMVAPYAMFYCMISYSFVTIILNILDIWNVVKIPKEMSFFNEPYIPSLILDPVCFITLLIVYLRRRRLAICIDCKLSKGLAIERGKMGEIISVESKMQLQNLVWLFGALSVIVWFYFFVFYYQNALVNNKDWYVFFGVNVFAVIFDEVYFAARYYNMYLDLKENGEIITEEELSDMTMKTYLRFYVICGNHVYLNANVADPLQPKINYIDTPFVTKRNVNGITTAEVLTIIRKLTGEEHGELRFFFGRKSQDISKHRILRYFYFLDGEPEDHPEIRVDGEWLDFKMMNAIYNLRPDTMSKILLSDISRMSTIILTQKLFDENGYRKIKVRSYHPSYDLKEVREQNYDFQDDKWIRISMFNSDLRGFHFKRWWNKFKRNRRSGEWQRNQ